MEKKPKLLDDSSDSEIDFQINKGYAENYEKWRKKEELQKLKDRYGDDLSSTSSESEEETPVVEKDFLKTLSLLKSKDPQIYDKNVTFFNEETKVEKKPKEKKPKPLYMKDYERKLILERNGEVSDDDDAPPPNISPTYDEEQEQIKSTFKAALADSDSEEESLLQVRKKNKAEEEKEEADYIQWLKGEGKKLKGEDNDKELKFLRDFWNDPNLDESEQFLKDYILNKKYVEDDKSDYIPTYDDITNDIGTLSDDEKLLETQATFEHKYNFRFEEPDAEFIKQYPRTIGDSLRKKDTKRKMKREEYQERKHQEKEQKREEIKRLKALKRKEIEEKIKKLRETVGNEELELDAEDIEGDFDPAEHDKKMRELFSEEYYNVEELEKPQFPSDEELDQEDWDNWVGENEGNEDANLDEDCGPRCEDSDFVMDADYDPKLEFQKQMIESSQSKKKKRKKSKFASALSKEKPAFDPLSKSFEQYFDEYYKLDCEDIIGDLPVRYKYREVVPNDFGLTVNEILSAKDKELNRWCSVKKTCQYRLEEEEIHDVEVFKNRAQNEHLKKKIFLSLQNNNEEQKPSDANTNPPETGKKKKKKSKKECLRNESNLIETGTEEVQLDTNELSDNVASVDETSSMRDDKAQEAEHQSDIVETKKKKKKKRKRKNNGNDSLMGENSNGAKRFKISEPTDARLNLPDNRLKAYGINPKKFKKQIKYSNIICK